MATAHKRQAAGPTIKPLFQANAFYIVALVHTDLSVRWHQCLSVSSMSEILYLLVLYPCFVLMLLWKDLKCLLLWPDISDDTSV